MSSKATRFSRVCHAVIGCTLMAFSQHALANAPVGVRPCCAFGKDLKAQVGGVPVPFFSVGNVLEASQIGEHVYNDGSQGVSSSLLGIGEERNGLIYTKRGGFIDTAHVRDTADFTYYLFAEVQKKLGQNAEIHLPSELRKRVIVLKQNDATLSDEQAKAQALAIASLMAFRLAQWHEIAQWFGMESVGGFKELASAFSPEDLYSNMLGALLAQKVLAESPALDKKGFSAEMNIALRDALNALDALSANETEKRIEGLDGKWWDSSQRLPDKWVLLRRDYNLSLSMLPNTISTSGMEAPLHLNLPERAPNGDLLSDWVAFELRADDAEKAFSALPISLRSKTLWDVTDFQQLADFAKVSDEAALRLRQ